MGISLDGDDHVIWLEFVEPWTWAEYDQVIDDACLGLDHPDVAERHAQRPASLVFNLLEGPVMPLDHVFSHLQRSAQLLPRRIDLLLVIGADQGVKGLLYVFSRTNNALGWMPMFVDSVEE